MNKILSGLRSLQKSIENTFKMICLFCGAGLFLLLSGNVFTRIFPIVSLHWFGEIVELLFAWLIFLGAAVLYSQKEHFMIDWLHRKTAGTSLGAPYQFIINLICLVFAGTLLIQGFRLTMMARDLTSILHMPRKWFYSSMPVGALFMVYCSLVEIVAAFVKPSASEE